MRCKFSSLYNHKKPTDDPTYPAYVRNAKRIFEHIKEVIDISEGEGTGDGAVGAVGAVNGVREDVADVAVAVHHIPPMEGLVGDVVGNEDGEDGAVASSTEGGGNENRVSGSVAEFSTSVANPLVGTTIHSRRSS